MVTVDAQEVADFAAKWPCAHFIDRSITFTFDRRNGDLVDYSDAWQGRGVDESALAALADDAKAYAKQPIFYGKSLLA